MERIELGPCSATLRPADRTRVAIVLPGGEYATTAPVLWYAGEALAVSGWTVLAIDQAIGRAEPGHVSADRLSAALAWAGDGARTMIVGESVSIPAAARVAADRSLPGVWFTPVLTDRKVADVLGRIEAPGLLVGSVDDPTWRAGEASRLRRMEVLQLTGCGHSLQVPGDPLRSIELLGKVTARVLEFGRRVA